MISIHLRRTGAKKDPHYRVVVTDSRVARDGAFIEVLGHYHPRYEPAKVVLDVEKTRAWIDKGAQPSDTVRSLLRKVESGSVDVGQAVSPSRQRDTVKHAEIRANAPAADDADGAATEATADDAAEATAPAEEAPGSATDAPEDAPEAEAGAEEAAGAAEPEAAAVEHTADDEGAAEGAADTTAEDEAADDAAAEENKE